MTRATSIREQKTLFKIEAPSHPQQDLLQRIAGGTHSVEGLSTAWQQALSCQQTKAESHASSMDQ